MDRFLPFVNREQCRKIWLDDIMYIMQDGRVTYIVTDEETFNSYHKIKEMEQYLDGRFYYCLKKVVINFQKVSTMKDQTIFFRNGDTISLGRQNYVKTRQAFAIYIKKSFGDDHNADYSADYRPRG